MKQIKVLHVATAFQSIVTILAGKLRILSTREGIVCHAASSPDPEEARVPAVRHFAIDIPRTIRPWRDIEAVIRLRAVIRENGYDIVHTHTAKAGMAGAFAARLCGTPCVHTYHGLPFFYGQSTALHNLYKVLETGACRIRSAVLSQNRTDFDALKGMKSIRCPVFFEGNGVDAGQIEKSSLAQSGAAGPVFSQGKTKIICVARLEPVKRLETVINAVQFLNRAGVASECVIAGKGALRADLERLIAVRNLERSVKIVYTPFIHALVKQADVAVLASEKEGIPRGLMEAMALKKPVVATDVVGTSELVVNGETGILVPYGNQHAFNEALKKLSLDKNLREKYGQAGHKRIREHFDENKIVDLWVDIYKRVLKIAV
ncbi:MAG TPA: glycosyltransferase [Chitinivibrionales bacterium]|nr:glycosyltransferase [Chitinivibrionales bacterium]